MFDELYFVKFNVFSKVGERYEDERSKLLHGERSSPRLMKKAKPAKKRMGPKPDRVKIEGDWESAVAKALEKKRPVGGWPDQSGSGKSK